MTACRLIAIALAVASATGCARWKSAPALPSRHHLTLDQLLVFSDTALPKHHRLLEELRTQRNVVLEMITTLKAVKPARPRGLRDKSHQMRVEFKHIQA